MESYFDSSIEDEIFWEKLEQKPILLAGKIKAKEQESRNMNPNALHRKLTTNFLPAEALKNSQVEWNIEKLENSMARIKDSSEEQIRSVSIIVKNQTRKELLQTVINIQKDFQEEVFAMKKDQERMQEEQSTKTRLMISLLDFATSQFEVENRFGLIEPEPVIASKAKEDTLNELKELIEKDNTRFEAIRILNNEFREEANTANSKVMQIDAEINKINNAHKAVVHALENTIGAREKVILKETQSLQDEFDEYKLKISQEIQVRNLLHQRQGQFIENLVAELKNAKVILQNPTLRLKTYEKLREYATPSGKDLLFSKYAIPTSDKYLFPKIGQSQKSTKFGDSRLLTSPFEPLSSRSNKSTRRAKSSFKP